MVNGKFTTRWSKTSVSSTIIAPNSIESSRLLLRRTCETITGKSQTRCLGAKAPPASVESAFESVSSPVHFDEYIKKGSDGTVFHVGMPIVVLIQQGYRERPFVQFE